MQIEFTQLPCLIEPFLKLFLILIFKKQIGATNPLIFIEAINVDQEHVIFPFQNIACGPFKLTINTALGEP